MRKACDFFEFCQRLSGMSKGEVRAWHYATRQPVRLKWEAGTIVALEPSSTPPPENLWLAPGIFDLQINGYGGIDFQQDNTSLEELLSAARQLRAAGCTRFLLTLITDDWPKLTARLRHLRGLRQQSAELQSAIAGWHVEGPFLSAEPGFHGAHDPSLMLDPTPAHIQELRATTENDPLLLTIAPERRGALEAIAFAKSLGIKTSLGHTNAPAEILRKAVEAGATAFTHLGNGCPRELDRHDNIVWRALDTAGLAVGLIPDQIHLSPVLFRLIHRVLGGQSIYYTTDAMSAAGAGPGSYKLGALELQVGADQVVRQPGKTNFAGSALRPIDGVLRAAAMLNCPWQEVWDKFSGIPARTMGLSQSLQVGKPANFCLLKLENDQRLQEIKTFSHGAV
jgi:N-acetylglucosamine-6-phosphate deacetylase